MAAELASEVGPVRPGADDAGVAGHDAVLIFRGARASGAERSRAVVGIGEVMEQSMGATALAANFIEGDRLESGARIGAKSRRGHQKSPQRHLRCQLALERERPAEVGTRHRHRQHTCSGTGASTPGPRRHAGRSQPSLPPPPPPPGLPRAPSRLPRPSRPAALFREDPHRHLIDGFSPSLRFASCQDYAAGSLSPVSVLAASRCSPGRQRRGGRPAAGSELAARRRGGRCGVLSFSLLCFRTSLSSISPALCTGARRGRTTSARTCGSGGRTGSGGPGGTGAAAGCGTCPRRPPGPSQKRRTA